MTRRNFAPRKCEVCGANFTPRSASQKTCSPKCRAELTHRLVVEARLRSPNLRGNGWIVKRCRFCGRRFSDRAYATFSDMVARSICTQCRTKQRCGGFDPIYDI